MSELRSTGRSTDMHRELTPRESIDRPVDQYWQRGESQLGHSTSRSTNISIKSCSLPNLELDWGFLLLPI